MYSFYCDIFKTRKQLQQKVHILKIKRFDHHCELQVFCVQKLHGFIFEKIMVLTRPATRGNQLRYQVYRQPIPLAEMVLVNLADGQKMGSFKSTFTTNSTSGRRLCIIILTLYYSLLHWLILHAWSQTVTNS